MPLPFQQQIQIVGVLLDAQRLAICVGSGISRRRLPLLHQIIALAFRNIPLTAESRETFRASSQFHHFHAQLAVSGIATSDPCTLEEFRALDPAEQAHLCESLTATYGDIFATLEHVVGSKCALLDCIEFLQFGTTEADAAHFYIGYMILEGVFHRVLTTNWDRLIESAVSTLTDIPITSVVELLIDRPTWLDRNQGAHQLLAKVHGCITQYPDSCDQIVLTTPELQLATADGWRRDAVNELLTGTVLFSGYSASDYTLMVPLQVLAQLRAQDHLDSSHFYIAQESDLSAGGRNLLQNNDAKHIQLWANDVFASLYFAYIRRRLQLAIANAEQQLRLERAFPNWTDASWANVIDRLKVLTTEDLGMFLDSIIGQPNARAYDDRASSLPVGLSALRAIFLTGKVPARGKYHHLQFDPNKDIVLLILLATLIDLIRSPGGPSLSFESTHAGITFTEGSGSRRKLCFLYGIYQTAAYHSISTYLNEIESTDGQLPEFEIAVVPCSRYEVPDDAPPPGPILGKMLPGGRKAQRRFVDPTSIFQTTSYDALITTLRAALELS
jgi:hypothetical protein